MMNLGRVVLSRRFSQSFTVYRKTGAWFNGRWTPNPDASITMTGTITVPSETDLEQVPEGDRVKGAICVFSTQQLYQTNSNGTSDEILWNGERYRVSKLWPQMQYGFYKAIAVRMDGV